MKIKYPSIFPGPLGNLVIGPYPHGVTSPNYFRTERQPFLAVEIVDDRFVCRAAGDTFAHVAKYMGPNRWIVWPNNWDGSTLSIYED